MAKKHFTSTDMLHAAFRFRRAELWNKLSDSQIYAVALPSGEKGYCITMGNGGTYYGLGLYRGEKGFSTFLRMIHPSKNEVDAMADVLTYDVINCNFSQANSMNFGIKEPVREFSKKFEMPIPKKNGWPEFVRYRPFHDIAPVDDATDGDDIAAALHAATHLAKLLESQTPQELGFLDEGHYPSEEGGREVPLLVHEGFNKWHLEKTTLPAMVESEYPTPLFTDEKSIQLIRQMPKGNIIECGTLSIPMRLGNNPENNAPFIIPILDNGYLSMVMCMRPYDLYPELLLHDFIQNITQGNSVPKAIVCTDELTEKLLRDFCLKTGIKQILKNKSEEFNYAAFELFSSLTSRGFF